MSVTLRNNTIENYQREAKEGGGGLEEHFAFPVAISLAYWTIFVKFGMYATWHSAMKIILIVYPNALKKYLKCEKKKKYTFEISVCVKN